VTFYEEINLPEISTIKRKFEVVQIICPTTSPDDFGN
jgi:hypothetical protein